MPTPVHFLLRSLVLSTVMSICLAIRLQASDLPGGSLNDGKCRMIINEANLYPNGAYQFVELKKVCEIHFKPKQFPVNMKFYKLLFISHDGFMIAACHLEGKASANSKGGNIFYVISNEMTTDGNMDYQSCHFPADTTGITEKRLPIGDAAPVGIALVYSPSQDTIKDLDLIEDQPGVYGKTKIDSRAEKKIRENLMDLIIVTASSPYTHCEYFENFVSGYNSASFSVLRDWAQLDTTTERSLSRCSPKEGLPIRSHFHPFQPTLFLYASPSKGQENFCDDAVKFLVEEKQPARKVPRRDFTEAYQCSITTEDAEIERSNIITDPFSYNRMLRETILSQKASQTDQQNDEGVSMEAQEVEQESCVNDPFADHNALGSPPPPPFKKSALNTEKFEEDLNKMMPLFAETCESFPHDDFVQKLKCSKDPPVNSMEVLRDDTCFWLEWLPNQSLRCRLCNKLLQQGIIKDRPGSPLVTKIMTVGQINRGRRARTLNRGIIQRHLVNPLHLLAVHYAKLFQSGLRADELKKMFETPGGVLRVFTNATENLMGVGFSLAFIDLPFHRYPRMRELLEFFNANIGHVYANPIGIQRIQRFISDTMHEELISFLKQKTPEFSLLIDTSTDVASIPALAIVFQTYDADGNVKLLLYKVVWVEGRETGEEMFQLFLREIRKDGLDKYVQDKCVGFASDGGSNVLLFREKLKAYTTHADRMIMVHCLAHKSELVMKHAWEKMPYILGVENSVNTLHRIFGCRSAKKKRHLQIAQAELGDTKFSLGRLHKTRWVAPRLRALDKVVIHWKTIVKALQRVREDSTIKDSKQRLLAKETQNMLLDPTFIITTAFVADVYTAMSSVSLKLQDRGSTLIGKKELRNKLKETLTAMKTTNGPFVRSILQSSRFSSPSLQGQAVTVENFESGNIYLQNMALNKPNEETSDSRLYKNRQGYISRIISQLDLYFPEDPTDNLDILDPSHWPLNAELEKYGNEQMKLLNSKLRWSYNEKDLLQAWTSLKLSVVTHLEFGEKRRSLNPEAFWAFYLKQDSIAWPSSVRQIITNVITIPASTAEVERIFSYYTQIKTARRYNLDVSTVDALIRIRFNGPRSLSQFDTLKYAWKFLEKHARPDDSSKCMTRKKKTTVQAETEPFFEGTAVDQIDLTERNDQGEPEDADMDDISQQNSVNGANEFDGTWYSACAAPVDENGSEQNEFEILSSEEDEDDLDEMVREMELEGQD